MNIPCAFIISTLGRLVWRVHSWPLQVTCSNAGICFKPVMHNTLPTRLQSLVHLPNAHPHPSEGGPSMARACLGYSLCLPACCMAAWGH